MIVDRRVRTYIRPHKRQSVEAQMELAEGKVYVDGQHGITRETWLTALRKNEIAAVTHIHLLAAPRSKAVPHPQKDWWVAFKTAEKRAAYVLELSSGLRSDRKEDRDKMIADAQYQIASGGRASKSVENGRKSRGRPIPEFTAQQWKEAEAVFFDSRLTVKEKRERMKDMPISWDRVYRKQRETK